MAPIFKGPLLKNHRNKKKNNKKQIANFIQNKNSDEGQHFHNQHVDKAYLKLPISSMIELQKPLGNHYNVNGETRNSRKIRRTWELFENQGENQHRIEAVLKEPSNQPLWCANVFRTVADNFLTRYFAMFYYFLYNRIRFLVI